MEKRRPNPRQFTHRAAATGAFTWLLRRLNAPGQAAPRRSVARLSRRIGSLEVVALLDASGPFHLPRQSAFPTATSADWEAAMLIDPGAFGDGGVWELDFHCFAIRRGNGGITLVDCGVGPVGSPAAGWAPVPGRLPDALVEEGIASRDVDLVVMTHLHEDHVGWAVRPDRTPMFPNAEYLVQRTEVSSLEQSPDRTVWEYVIEPLRSAGQMREVDGPSPLPGGARGSGDRVTAIPTPGHTAGHQSVVVDGPQDQVVVTGDALVHAVQLANPDVGYVYEADQPLARRTRRALLEQAHDKRALLATAHFTQPFVLA
jgi:glyoxylase-like metal-dependent hydrolase (beta-lactamase superfamily II)